MITVPNQKVLVLGLVQYTLDQLNALRLSTEYYIDTRQIRAIWYISDMQACLHACDANNTAK